MIPLCLCFVSICKRDLLSVNTPFWNKLRNFYDVVDQILALVELNNKVVTTVVFFKTKALPETESVLFYFSTMITFFSYL